jgi:hypothetical protein
MKLIEEARQAWKMWSVKLAAVTGLMAALVASNQTIALGLIYFLPEGPLRLVVAGAIGLVVFVIPTALRLLQQPKLSKTDEPE